MRFMGGSGIWHCAAAVLLLVLPACNSVPRPFEGADRNDPMLDAILSGAKVGVPPVEGLDKAQGIAFARAVATAAQEREIPAVTGEGALTGERIVGKAEFSEPEIKIAIAPSQHLIGRKGRLAVRFGTGDRQRRAVYERSQDRRIVWTVIDQAGAEVDRFISPMPSGPPGGKLSRRDMEAAAREVASALRASLNRRAAGSANAAAAGRPILLLSPVAGAPGDGRVSLTSAVAELLTMADVGEVMAAWDRPALPEGRTIYRITSQMRVTDLDSATQEISIVWSLAEADGTAVGTVTQKNQVQRGSLDGKWGRTAYLAAEGARDGILSLITQARTESAHGMR